MIKGYAVEEGHLVPMQAPLEALERLVWLDLFHPTDAEEGAIEAALGIAVPTPDEMQEIEDSSRLYLENGAIYMTANLPSPRTERNIWWLGLTSRIFLAILSTFAARGFRLTES